MKSAWLLDILKYKRYIIFPLIFVVLVNCVPTQQILSHTITSTVVGNESPVEFTATKSPRPTQTIITRRPSTTRITGKLTPEFSTSASSTATRSWKFQFTPTYTLTPESDSGINSLTGQRVLDINILNRRPVMVKVSNYPRTIRPQSGISFADMVFEYYIGEGNNRFLALFYGDNANKIGPIRSGRLVDAQLTEMYQGLLVYGGADDRVNAVITSPNLLGNRAIDTRIPHDCPPICGIETHSEEGVFADSASISDYANKNGIINTKPDLSGIFFTEITPESIDKAVQIGIQFSKICRSEWRYDINTHQYLRWTEEDDNLTLIPMLDGLTGQPLVFDNVIILFTNYIIYNLTLYDIELWQNTGGQRALLFRDGVMIEALWSTHDDIHPIQLKDAYGKPLGLKPGKSWVVLLDNLSSMTSIKSGILDLKFSLP
jgi:hypothetical protein